MANPNIATFIPASQQNPGDDAAMRMILPVGRSIYAIVAGYLGLMSLAACFLGPVAVVFGILAIRDIRRDSSKHGMVRAILGIVLGLIGSLLLVGFLIGILFAEKA